MRKKKSKKNSEGTASTSTHIAGRKAVYPKTYLRDAASSAEPVHAAKGMYELKVFRLDVYLCNNAGTSDTPLIYVIKDRLSRLILATHVGVGEPNWQDAKYAILNIGGDKETRCRQVGIPYSKEDWPGQGLLPRVLVCSCADAEVTAANCVSLPLKISVFMLPYENKQTQSGILTNFKQTEVLLNIGMSMTSSVAARTVQADRLSLNLAVLEQLVWRDVVSWNHARQVGVASTFSGTSGARFATPIEVWNQEKRGAFESQNLHYRDDVMLELLPRGVGRLTRSGLHFAGLYYDSEAFSDKDFLRREATHVSLDVIYDERSANRIWVKQNNGRIIEAGLSMRSREFSALSFYEVKEIQKMQRKRMQAYLHQRLNLAATLPIETGTIK